MTPLRGLGICAVMIFQGGTRGAAVTVVAAAAVVVSCGGDDASAPPTGDGTTPAADVAKDNASPPAAGEVLVGVFVSSTRGDDANDGSDGAKPLRTLKAAFARANERQVRVFACAEEYAEAVELVDGVSAYGTFDCGVMPWRRVDRHATIRPNGTPVAVRAVALTKATRLDGFDVLAADATTGPGTPAASSVGVYARGAANLVVANALVRAGKGADGEDGVEPAPDAQQETSARPGGLSGVAQGVCTEATCLRAADLSLYAPGGAGGTSTCAVGPSGGPGGAGGRGGFWSSNGNAPIFAFDSAGGGGTAVTAAGGSNAYTRGKAGANGGIGTRGANGTRAFSAEGFVPGDGANGGIGAPGQGGGGGGGMREYCMNTYTPPGPTQFTCDQGTLPEPRYHGGSGGGGGAGGCPGIPGTAGKGGGASIGVLLIDAPAILEDVRIEAGVGGRAGKGTLGLEGLPGGTGAAHVSWGAPGGNGGQGGPAGTSGHGSAGPSYALSVRGPAPTRTNVVLVAGRGGLGQPALARGEQVVEPAPEGEAVAENAF